DNPVGRSMAAMRQLAHLAFFVAVTGWASNKVFGHGEPPCSHSRAYLGSPLFGAEAPAFRHEVSAVCSPVCYTARVLRHPDSSGTTVGTAYLPNRTCGRCWQEALPA